MQSPLGSVKGFARGSAGAGAAAVLQKQRCVQPQGKARRLFCATKANQDFPWDAKISSSCGVIIFSLLFLAPCRSVVFSQSHFSPKQEESQPREVCVGRMTPPGLGEPRKNCATGRSCWDITRKSLFGHPDRSGAAAQPSAGSGPGGDRLAAPLSPPSLPSTLRYRLFASHVLQKAQKLIRQPLTRGIPQCRGGGARP